MNAMAVKTATIGGNDDWGKWLRLAALLTAAGILPGRWARPIALAAVTAWFLRQL
jgi:hypothetical protein